jgi:hypothetical protein
MKRHLEKSGNNEILALDELGNMQSLDMYIKKTYPTIRLTDHDRLGLSDFAINRVGSFVFLSGIITIKQDLTINESDYYLALGNIEDHFNSDISGQVTAVIKASNSTYQGILEVKCNVEFGLHFKSLAWTLPTNLKENDKIFINGNYLISV